MKTSDFKQEDELKKMKVADIKKHIKEFNEHYAIKGYSKLKKDQLINAVLTAQMRISKSMPKVEEKKTAPKKKARSLTVTKADGTVKEIKKKAPKKEEPKKEEPKKGKKMSSLEEATVTNLEMQLETLLETYFEETKPNNYKINKPKEMFDYFRHVLDDNRSDKELAALNEKILSMVKGSGDKIKFSKPNELYNAIAKVLISVKMSLQNKTSRR